MLLFPFIKLDWMLHLSWQVCFRTGYRRIFCILKKRTLVSLLWEGGLNSTWMVVYGYVLTAACKCLFFEKVWGWPYLSLFYGCRKHPAFHTSHGTWNQPGQGGLASVAVNSEPLSVSRTWTYLLKSCVPRGGFREVRYATRNATWNRKILEKSRLIQWSRRESNPLSKGLSR